MGEHAVPEGATHDGCQQKVALAPGPIQTDNKPPSWIPIGLKVGEDTGQSIGQRYSDEDPVEVDGQLGISRLWTAGSGGCPKLALETQEIRVLPPREPRRRLEAAQPHPAYHYGVF